MNITHIYVISSINHFLSKQIVFIWLFCLMIVLVYLLLFLIDGNARNLRYFKINVHTRKILYVNTEIFVVSKIFSFLFYLVSVIFSCKWCYFSNEWCRLKIAANESLFKVFFQLFFPSFSHSKYLRRK